MITTQKNLIKKQFQRLRKSLDTFDKLCLGFIHTRSTLIAALLGVSLLIWGLIFRDGYLIIQVLFSAAIGYGLGFIPGVVFDVVIAFIRLNRVHFQVVAAPFPVLQFFICAYITWLGFRHHQISILLKEKLGEMKHPDRIVPWSFINDVRNSLMAMRLLLFHHTTASTNKTDFKLVEEELLRLERLFGTLPEGEHTNKKSTLG